MAACMKDATTSSQRRACVTGAGKTNIASALGKRASEVSATEVREFLAEGATDKMKEMMTACVAEAADAAAKRACGKGAALKSSLAASLGKAETDVKQLDVEMFKRKAALSGVKDAMQACMAEAATPAERRACRTTNAKAALTECLGKESNEVRRPCPEPEP